MCDSLRRGNKIDIRDQYGRRELGRREDRKERREERSYIGEQERDKGD